jgi:hypothetical protein
MPPQITSFEPHARQPDSFRKPRQGDLILFSQISSIRNEGRHEPYEPEVGNTPTTNTFVWTWASFCFTFLAFGLVLFIYEFWLNHPDDAPMDPVLVRFRPLTESQTQGWQVFPRRCCRPSGAGCRRDNHGARLL